MKTVVKTYGVLAITGIVAIAVIAILVSTTFKTSKGEDAKGVVGVIAEEAATNQEDDKDARVGTEMADVVKAPDTTYIKCTGSMYENVATPLSDLFYGTDSSNNLPIKILRIKDSSGKTVKEDVAFIEDDKLTITTSGMYQIYIKANASKPITKDFCVYVNKQE